MRRLSFRPPAITGSPHSYHLSLTTETPFAEAVQLFNEFHFTRDNVWGKTDMFERVVNIAM
jgi:hypothetical protein